MSFEAILTGNKSYWETSEVLSMMIGEEILNLEINRERDTVTFIFQRVKITLLHQQDCCESVVIDDVNGDIDDFRGQILLTAEERTNDTDDTKPDDPAAYHGESETWTFYTFRTVKGSLDIKFHGESNGYYSERVDVSVETL